MYFIEKSQKALTMVLEVKPYVTQYQQFIVSTNAYNL